MLFVYVCLFFAVLGGTFLVLHVPYLLLGRLVGERGLDVIESRLAHGPAGLFVRKRRRRPVTVTVHSTPRHHTHAA